MCKLRNSFPKRADSRQKIYHLNAQDNKALQRLIFVFFVISRTMTSQGRSENSDMSGPLHPMLPNANLSMHKLSKEPRLVGQSLSLLKASYRTWVIMGLKQWTWRACLMCQWQPFTDDWRILTCQFLIRFLTLTTTHCTMSSSILNSSIPTLVTVWCWVTVDQGDYSFSRHKLEKAWEELTQRELWWGGWM